MSLIEIVIALGIFAVVSYIITGILDSTFRTQRQAELKYDLQTFIMRTVQDVDCDKTFKVGEVGALYDKATNTFPTNSTCGALTLKTSSGNTILAPDTSAQSLFVGAGPISKNWWAKAECDESQRSITLKVALRKQGSWTQFGKNPLRDPKDSADTQHFMGWGNTINPIIGGTQKIKLCEKYFSNTTPQNSACDSSKFATGYNSNNLRCNLLPAQPSPNPADCGTGKIMVSFNMMTNTPVCKDLTTADLDSTTLISWMKSQIIPSCFSGQLFTAASSNSMTCTNTAQTKHCASTITSDYLPAFTASNCGLIPGYYNVPGGLFDHRTIDQGIGK